MNWQTHRKILLKDQKVKKALEKSAVEYQVARALIKARIDRSLTQVALAKKLGTKQSVISRVENAKTVPSLSFLKKVAYILDMPLRLQFG